MRKIALVFVAALLVGLVAGCAQPPQETIDAANAAVEGARASGAAEYAPESLRAAEDAQAQLEAEMKAQESKFSLFRSYKKVADLSTAASSAGERALADAQAAKARKQEEARAALDTASSMLAETRSMLEKAPRGKGTQADLAAMKADLDGAEAALAEAGTAMSSESYLDALAKAKGATATVESVKAAVEEAMARKGGRRR